MKRLIVLILAMALVGCAGMSKEEQGAIGGAIIGIALGALVGDVVDCQGCAAIGGAIGGVAIGSAGAAWGRDMDKLDHQQRQLALEQTRTNEAKTWTNPDTGAEHRMVLVKTYENQQGYCREFQHDVVIAGESQQSYGTACRQPDGSWKIQ